MGVCLSRASHGQPKCEDDGFCMPEPISEQYESGNPSGRYSYGLDTPRSSAEVGDLGVLGSLFYRRGSRSRDTPHLNYLNPLEMFLGVSGKKRLQNVNRMCSGDFSLASYLSSPLLKGFDVHAMEAVAKTYAESAAKAAARDAFVFLEENDVCSSFTASPSKVFSAEETGDADDDNARSGESEWEEPLRKSEDWDARKSEDWDAQVAQFDDGMSRGISTSGRLDTILHSVQARAKAKRRQRRKSTPSSKEAGDSKDRTKKLVRFQIPAESEEEFTDDDLRSCMESESEAVRAQDEAESHAEQETKRAAFYEKANGSEQHLHRFQDQRERIVDISASGLASLRLREEEEQEEAFHGFSISSGTIDCQLGGTTPVVGPSGRSTTEARTSSAAGSASADSSADYYVPCSSLSSSSNQQDEFTALSLKDDDNEATSGETCLRNDIPWGTGHQEGRQQNDIHHRCQPSDDFSFASTEGYNREPQEFEFHPQSVNEDEFPEASEVHAPVSDVPTPIPVGCVVVESRFPDGSRNSPQIIDLDEVELPGMSGNHNGFLVNRIFHHGGSSPALESTVPEQEGSFTFPCLLVPSSSYAECSPYREPRGLWKDPPITDLRSSGRPHSSRFQPTPSFPPTTASSSYVDLDYSSPRFGISDEIEGPRFSFSFDVEPTSSKKSQDEIVLAGPSTRSSPISPSKLPAVMSRNLLSSSLQQSAALYPPRSRRGLSKKLKFYSLEKASYAAGAKRSRSPPTFVRKQRRDDIEGDSSSDLFEIETLSGTNAMGSSRTPPPTPVKVLKVSPTAAFDLNRLSSSIAQVSRSRSKRASSKDKPLPLAPSREKSRWFQKNRVSDYHQESSSILKGRAFLKLGLLRRSKFSNVRSRNAETDLYQCSETSGSEYLENKPPSQDPGNEMPTMRPYMDDEKMNSAANLAFQWNCSVAQRRSLCPNKRHLQTDFRTSCNEDRTFAVKN